MLCGETRPKIMGGGDHLRPCTYKTETLTNEEGICLVISDEGYREHLQNQLHTAHLSQGTDEKISKRTGGCSQENGLTAKGMTGECRQVGRGLTGR